jgi:thiol-disulfide isomerase/thioredoxin
MMRMKRIKGGAVFTILFLTFFGCATTSEMQVMADAEKGPDTPPQKKLPTFELAVPEKEEDRVYLGVAGNGDFQVRDIQGKVLVIEIFSMYCPHCQREAPKVNTLYRMIGESAHLKDKVKIIGIGAANSSFEINLFKNKYEVPFPLFPDKELRITNLLQVGETPTFIVVKTDTEEFYSKSGPFEDVQDFLGQMRRFSGLS